MNARSLRALALGLLLGGIGVLLVLLIPRAPDGAHDTATQGALAAGGGPQRPQAVGHEPERLRRAQEEYLEALALNQRDRIALQGLAAVRRALARGDPVVLKHQALAYREASASGRPRENYTPAALALLAEASEMAVAEIERDRQRSARAATTPRPPRPAPNTQRRPGPREPLYLVRLGPFPLIDRAARIAEALRAGGLPVTIEKGQDARRFLVVSEVLPAVVAERRRAALEALGFRPRLRAPAGARGQVELGPFGSLAGAESIATDIKRRGYPATVVPENGTGHMIAVGPYPRSAIEGIKKKIRSRVGTETAVGVRPVR